MKRVLHETRLWENRILPLREWGCKQICKSRKKIPAALAVASGEELTIAQSSGRRSLPFAGSHSTCRWRRRTQSSVPTTHQRMTLVNKSPFLSRPAILKTNTFDGTSKECREVIRFLGIAFWIDSFSSESPPKRTISRPRPGGRGTRQHGKLSKEKRNETVVDFFPFWIDDLLGDGVPRNRPFSG